MSPRLSSILQPFEGTLRAAKSRAVDVVRRQPGGERVIQVSKVVLGDLQRALGVHPEQHLGERLPNSLVYSNAMPSFDDLAEEYPDSEVPPLDRRNVDETKLTFDQLHWRRYGYVVLPGLMPLKLINDYLDLRERHGIGLGGFENEVWENTADEIKAIGCYRALNEKIQELVGEELALNFTLTQFTSTERKWHQDDYLGAPNVFGRYCAAWIALGDIHPDSGPFEFVPGSQQWKGLRAHLIRERLEPHVRSWQGRQGEAGHWAAIAESFTTPAVETKIRQMELPVQKFLPRRGDVLLWHGKLVHRGSFANVRGMRRPAIICHYYPKNLKPQELQRYGDGGVYWKQKGS